MKLLKLCLCSASITKEQEQKLYGSFLVIVGRDLEEILVR